MSNRKPFFVSSRSIGNVIAELPSTLPFTGDVAQIDLFIGARGFEERVLAVPNILRSSGASFRGPTLLGRYETNEKDNSRRERELLPILSDLGVSPDYFQADSPEDTCKKVNEALGGGGAEPKHVLFDISGASAPLIFSTIGALNSISTRIRLTITYTAASKYHEPKTVSRDSPIGEWSPSDLRERGVRDVDVNELFRGIHHDHMPGYAIVFPSMYAPRLQRCLSHLGVGANSGAEGSVYWVLPSTTDPEHEWRQSATTASLIAMIQGQNLSGTMDPLALPSNRHTFCGVSDYLNSLRIVVEHVDQNAGSNISLIHMGTKMQAIGCALALCGRPEVALVGARPEEFSAQNYSAGIGDVLALTLPDLHEVVRKIGEVGMIDVECRP